MPRGDSTSRPEPGEVELAAMPDGESGEGVGGPGQIDRAGVGRGVGVGGGEGGVVAVGDDELVSLQRRSELASPPFHIPSQPNKIIKAPPSQELIHLHPTAKGTANIP